MGLLDIIRGLFGGRRRYEDLMFEEERFGRGFREEPLPDFRESSRELDFREPSNRSFEDFGRNPFGEPIPREHFEPFRREEPLPPPPPVPNPREFSKETEDLKRQLEILNQKIDLLNQKIDQILNILNYWMRYYYR